jgi:hypothetical protein
MMVGNASTRDAHGAPLMERNRMPLMEQSALSSRLRRGLRRGLLLWTWLFVALLVLAPLPAAAQETPAPTPAAPAPTAPASGAQTLAACSDVDESTLLDELNTVTQQVFGDALVEIDILAIVEDQWGEMGLDAVVRAEVDRAVARIRNETDWWTMAQSNWSGARAQELTQKVAVATFSSEAFRRALDDLSTAVANDIAAQIGAYSAQSVSAALFCLQTFIRANYSGALLQAFEDEVRVATAEAGVNPGDLSPGLLQVIDAHKVALGGIGVIIAAQISRRLVTRVASRISTRVAGGIAGRVLGRVGTTVIPLVGWLVGAGMIAYDIYDSLDGALPQIEQAIKSDDTMEGIRAEIAAAIEPELSNELPAVARELANDLYSQWLAVKRDLRVLLELADANPAFAALLAQTETPEAMGQLVSVTAPLLNAAGRDAVLAAAEDGSLERAMTLGVDLGPIVAQSGSLQTALAWADLAGSDLDEVVRLELYKFGSPDALDRTTLQQLVALDDPAAIARIATLPPEQMRTLLSLSSLTLDQLTETFTTEQLGSLAITLAAMTPSDRSVFVGRLVTDPGLLDQVEQSGLLESGTLPAGASLDEALTFLSSPSDAFGIFNDTVAVVTDDATWGMFRMKYGWGVTILSLAVVILLLLLLLRLLWAGVEWLIRPLRGARGR